MNWMCGSFTDVLTFSSPTNLSIFRQNVFLSIFQFNPRTSIKRRQLFQLNGPWGATRSAAVGDEFMAQIRVEDKCRQLIKKLLVFLHPLWLMTIRIPFKCGRSYSLIDVHKTRSASQLTAGFVCCQLKSRCVWIAFVYAISEFYDCCSRRIVEPTIFITNSAPRCLPRCFSSSHVAASEPSNTKQTWANFGFVRGAKSRFVSKLS